MSRADWALCLILCFSARAFAQASARDASVPETHETGALTLSLEGAIAMAEQQSPLVRRAIREQAVVEAGRVGAAALLPANPALSVMLGGRRDSSGSVPASQGFEGIGRLEQTIEIGGQRGLRMTEAARAVDVARIRTELARVEARARVRAAYTGVLLARRHLEYARAQEALGQRVFESASARLQAGAGTDVDRNLAEVERGRLTQERVYAVLELGEALARLRRTLGIPLERSLELSSLLALPPAVTEALAPLVERAKSRRAELRALDASVSQLDAALLRLRRERVPSPTLSFEVMAQQPGQLYLGGGLSVPLPLWRRGQGEIAVALANRALVVEERGIFDDELGIEVERTHRAALALREAAEQWERVSVPAAERNLELVTQGWRSGKFDLFRVVQTAREAAEAQRRQLQLLGALWDATITLDRVTGGAP